MSKNVAVFVDVANIFYAAKAAGADIDYVTLLKAAVAGRDFVRAYAYTGLDPENENQRNFHSFLARNNYKVVSKDIRKYGDGKVKANLDIELVVDMMKTARNLDVAVVISGDGDFAPAIRAVQEMGVRVEVISFRGNTSSDLIEVADVFTDIIQVARVDRDSSRSGRRVAGDEEDLSMTEVPDKQTEGRGGRRGRGRVRDGGRTPDAAVAVSAGSTDRDGRFGGRVAGRGATGGRIAASAASAASAVMYLSVDGRAAGLLPTIDEIKPTAAEAVRELRRAGVEVWMVTGDGARVARSVAAAVGISPDHVLAEVLPAGKVDAVAAIQTRGLRVAMVGDGINDAPALARADVGIAIGTGADVAMEASDVTLVGGDPRAVATAIGLARQTRRVIRQNLIWAFGYNVVLIPVAMGALFPFFGVTLNPALAAAAMAMSSVSVVANSLRLRRVKLGGRVELQRA